MSGEGGKGMKKLPAFARSAGVLLPLFSLPSAYGIGCFSRDVDLFVDIAADMGFHWWQVLPLTVIGAGNSPYSGLSTFAGNSLLISPFGLYEDGLITKEEEEAARYRGEPYLVDYDFARENTSRVLHLAFDRLTPTLREEMQKFAKEEEYWLEDYALFMALSRERGTEWWKWESGLARRESKALAEAREKYAREVDYYRFEQFVFFRQWRAVLERVHERGVRVIGDLPFYVATDSVDVWVRPSEFVLDKHNAPAAYAGVPPDAFADKGQVWGNCLYDFAAMKKNRYTWWRRRISHCLGLYDALRLDHFRAFYNYFSIPASSGSAADGHWEQGPGQELIDLIRMDNPDALFIAEDLGLIDPDCREFIDNSGIPTMRVFQFGFDGTPSVHLPYRYESRNVAYTGTHDNNTTLGWLYELNPAARDFALKYCGFSGAGWGSGGPSCMSTKVIIRTVLASAAVLAVIPVQDLLGYGADTRINIPGTPEGNWRFRMQYELMHTVDRDYFLDMNNTYGRLGGGRA